MKIEELIYNYQDIEGYLKQFKNSTDYILSSSNGKIANILIKTCNLSFELSTTNLTILSKGGKIKKNGFSYIEHCGFIYKNYGEISIVIIPSKYAFLEETQEWLTDPLKFKINNKLIEISSASPLFVLLNEPIYGDLKYLNEFENFTTIKITNTSIKEIKTDTIKALFYLNSYFLKKINLIAKIYQMELDIDSDTDLLSDEYYDNFQKIKCKKVRKKYDFTSIEPLILYNQAQIFNNNEKFLYLYRVLEFFMNRARIQKATEVRHDSKISINNLIKLIENKNEEKLLYNLLIELLNINQKKKLINYALKNKLIKEEDFKSIPKELYKYRNSIVHAKEQQITEIKIPDLFNLKKNNPWIYLVDELALYAIMKYNISV